MLLPLVRAYLTRHPSPHIQMVISSLDYVLIAIGSDKYSVILPTYNERKNLPVIVWLLAKTFETQ